MFKMITLENYIPVVSILFLETNYIVDRKHSSSLRWLFYEHRLYLVNI